MIGDVSIRKVLQMLAPVKRLGLFFLE